MGHGAMVVLSLQEAAVRTETSKLDIWRAIQAGSLLAQRTDDGFAIDPAELFRVFEPQRPDERTIGQDGTASPEASERPETSATPDKAVPLAGLAAEVNGPLKLPAEAPADDELRQNREERQLANLAERNAQLAELVAERAKAEKGIAEYAALEERAIPWWRRFVGWIHTRRGRAARKRLRERL
jgi:hypothetical protein